MVYRSGSNQAEFARLAEGILRQRFVRACVYEVVFAYVVAAVGNMDVRRGVFGVAHALVSGRTAGHAAALYAVGVAALAVHGRLFAVERTAAGGAFRRVQRVLRRPADSAVAVCAYVAMSWFLTCVHGWMFGGGAARMWLYPEGSYGARQLNPAWVATWALATAVGASYGVQLVADERLQLAFPGVEQRRVYALKDRVAGAVARGAGFAAGVVWRFWAVYAVCGWAAYRAASAVAAGLGAGATRGLDVASPLLSARAVAFWLASATLTAVTWELAHRLFEVVATEPTHISSLSADRNACLLGGLRHADSALVQHLAFHELYRLATFGAAQRAELLADIDRSSGPMWAHVSAQCIAVIRAATEQLRASMAPAATQPKPAGSAGSAAPAAPAAGGAPVSDILKMKSRARADAPPQAKPDPAPLLGPEPQGLEKYVLSALRDALLLSPVGQRLLVRAPHAHATAALANFQQQVWAVRALMRLVECSLDEDPYGVVQNDIALVLATLFAYLAELERCAAAAQPAAAHASCQPASRQALAMIHVVRNALYSFTTTFYDYLDALKLPHELARQLQPFANFCA